MTQPPSPPPPPNQPPQGGGFGAPQTPPPGGFGPPPASPQSQQPQPPTQPAQPAVPSAPPGPPAPPAPPGPPAQPPTAPQGRPGFPPQQPPGYGYPQAPPGGPGAAPYGYPGQPQQPPGYPYGYPQGPGGPVGPGGFPTPPPAPQPPRKGLTTQLKIVIAAVAAVVLIVGGGVVYAVTSDDGKKNDTSSSGSKKGRDKGDDKGEGAAADGDGKEKAPDDVKSRVAFQLAPPPLTDITSFDGSWATDKAFVKPHLNSIVGYDRDKGSQLWQIPLPGQVCGASRHKSDDNKAAILFEAGKRTGSGTKNFLPCTEVGVIDMANGKLLWSASVTSDTSGDSKLRFSEVTQSGTTVAAGSLYGGAAFDLNSGKVLWKPTANEDECEDQGYAGGPELVAVRKCGDYNNEQLTIEPLNPTNGKPRFSYKMPAGVEYASVISTKPLVVAADVGDTGKFGISDFFSIDDKGALKAKISATGDKFEARCRSTEVESCVKVVVGNGRIYLPTAETQASGEAYGYTNSIVSFDLNTGKPLSGRADAGEKFTMFPIRMDGGNVIAYKEPPYAKGGQVVSLNGTTLKETVLMENPGNRPTQEAETSFSSDYAEYLYEDGRLYISSILLNKGSGGDASRRWLSVAYTTAD
ncbi:PQQ-binding-like beta-propeller repeat protein [Streptomyces sp. NPDC047315]|uniref:outer membrane protein assembly factor BamB family protein n=1 Tax=Streptomyces sp. NPDC047315 TaxID=3155142 RepID=UPI0033CCD3FA